MCGISGCSGSASTARSTSPTSTSGGCARRRRAGRSSGWAQLRTQAAQRDVRLLGHLSDYLHAREDRGEHPGALTREDMTGFLSWLHGRVPADNRRHIVVSSTRRTVQFARRHLAGSGQPAEGIGGGFQLYHEDLPWRTVRDPDEPGRALPRVVLAQLLDEEVLAPLDQSYHEYRVAFELIAHTGRRPGEICHLACRVSALRRGAGARRRQAAPPGAALHAREAACQVGEPADQPARRRADRGPAAAAAEAVPGHPALEAAAAAAPALQPDRAPGDDLPDAEQPRHEVGQADPAAAGRGRHPVRPRPRLPLRAAAQLRPAARRRWRPNRHAAEADGSPHHGDHADLLPGHLAAKARSDRAGRPADNGS